MSTRRRQLGLERVLGTPALFATAYGNVGSSIYYALGVTAVFALGLTPIVFIISGLIFAATAATYAEGTVRFPEAGGSSASRATPSTSSSLFGAAWAQMLNYIITIAISAFFVPHYLSIFWEPLRRRRGTSIGGIVVIVVLVAPEHRRRPGGGEPEHPPRRRRLRDAAPPRPARLRRSSSARTRCTRTSTSASRRPGRNFCARDPDRDDRVHGDRDRLEPCRGGARPAQGDPAIDLVGRSRRLCDLLHASVDRALRATGQQDTWAITTRGWPGPGERRLPQRPGSRSRREPRPARRC